MPQQSVGYGVSPLLPLSDPVPARERPVQFGPSVVVARGQVLGQILDGGADHGKWVPYDDDGTNDGRRQARAISKYALMTDSVGNIAFLDPSAQLPETVPADDDFGVHYPVTWPRSEIYFSGRFLTQALVGLDAAGVVDLGRLEEGTLDEGTLVFP